MSNKQMIKIYRVEYVDGQGPYNSSGRFTSDSIERKILYLMFDKHNDNPNTPAPEKDQITTNFSFEWSTYYFGCSSLEKLYQWFDGFIDYLLEMGFNIVEYEREENDIVFGISGKQLAFRKGEIGGYIIK